MPTHKADAWKEPLETAFGSFDLARSFDVSSCVVRRTDDDPLRSQWVIELRLQYEGRGVSLRFLDVQDARLPEFATSSLNFGEPCIEWVGDDGLERVRYRLTDELAAWFIECGAIEATVD